MKEIKKSKAWSIASLTTGVIGNLVFIAPYFGLPLSIIAIVLYYQNKESGMAKAGLVLGITGTVINAITLFILFVVLLFGFL